MVIFSLLCLLLISGFRNVNCGANCKWTDEATGKTLNLSSDSDRKFWTPYDTSNTDIAFRYAYTVCMNNENCNGEEGMASYWQYTSSTGPSGKCLKILAHYNETNSPLYYTLNDIEHWVFHFGLKGDNNQFTVNWRCNDSLSASRFVTYTGNDQYMTFYMDSPSACSSR